MNLQFHYDCFTLRDCLDIIQKYFQISDLAVDAQSLFDQAEKNIYIVIISTRTRHKCNMCCTKVAINVLAQ